MADINVFQSITVNNVLTSITKTFGDERPGSLLGSQQNAIVSYQAVLPVSGLVTKITAYLTGVSGGVKNKCAIYDSSKNLIAGGTTVENSSMVDGWNQFNFTTPKFLVAGTYYLCLWGDSSFDQFYYATSDVTAVQGAENLSYGSWPASIVSGTNQFSLALYASYTDTTNNPVIASDQTLVIDGAVITLVATDTFSVSDSTTVTDNFSSLINENLSVSDSTAVSDLAPTTILVMYINTSNQIVVTDSATLQIQTVAGYTISVSDTATVTDSTSEVTSALLFSVIQQMQVADLFQFLVSTSPSVSNTITVTDNYAFTITSLPTLAIPSAFDSTAVTDNASVTNSTLSINASDTVTTVDTQNAVSSFYIINQFESVAITDVYIETEVLEIYNDLNIYANWVPGLKIIG